MPSKQRRLDFGEHKPERMAQFAEIIAADPNRYRGLSLDLALRSLHRDGKPHDPAECPTCLEEREPWPKAN